MSDIFISHAEADAFIALDLVLALEEKGFSTWTYEIDSDPGISYLMQTRNAVKKCAVFIILISKTAISSKQLTAEIVCSHESNKHMMPLLLGLTHVELTTAQPEWTEAFGAAVSVQILKNDVRLLLTRIERSLNALGIEPSDRVNQERIREIQKTIEEYQLLTKPLEPSSPKSSTDTEVPPKREHIGSEEKQKLLAHIINKIHAFQQQLFHDATIQLVVKDKNGDQSMAVSDRHLSIGRDPECGLRLADECVSRHHAVLYHSSRMGWLIKDDESRNGTTLNGKSIKLSLIKPDDEIGIGPYKIIIRKTSTSP